MVRLSIWTSDALRCSLCCFLALLLFNAADAQEERKYPRLYYKGYTKSMTIFINPDDLDFLQTLHLFHNRSEVELQFSEAISVQVHNRNLLYTGNFFFQNDFGRQLEEAATDYADLSLLPIDRNGVKMINSLDRAFVQGLHGNLEWRLGRQRINWGLHSIWNPHDIFNAYSFVDFDYEERPGADAAFARYYFGFTTNVQLAYSPGDEWDESTLGMLWQTNVGTYDLQALTAYDRGYYVWGLGAAGNIGEQSLKFEGSSFIPEDGGTAEWGLALSFEGTTTQSGIFYNISYLYDSKINSGGQLNDLLQQRIDARNLYPFEHSFLLQALKQVSGRLTLNAALVTSIEETLPMYFAPSVAYSLSQNWDLDLFGQIFFEKEDVYGSPTQVLNVRIKWSY